jgi:hypothetical protein
MVILYTWFTIIRTFEPCCRVLPACHAQRRDPRHPAPKQPLSQMTFRQQKPVVACTIHQPSTVFTNRCCNLVSDQISIGLGNASRRHKFRRLWLQAHLVLEKTNPVSSSCLGVQSGAVSYKRHLLAKAVATTLILLTFGTLAIYLSHQARGRPQITAKLTPPQATSAPPAAQPPPKAIRAPDGLAIGGGNASNPTVRRFGSPPPRPLVLSAAQAQAVTDGMKRFAGQGVEICLAGNSTSEARAFGDTLEVALLNADMFVTRNITTMVAVGDGMNPPPGISILVGKGRLSKDSAANALALLLINNKVVDGLIPAFLSEKNPDRFAVLVTGENDND